MRDDFLYGTTAAAVSAEGVHPAADWSLWERERRVPASADGNGFLTNFGDDLALVASIGANAVRLTLEWARIEPVEGKVDSEALDRYADIVHAARRAGLQPWLTLHSTSLPGWFAEDEGGYRDQRAREYHWLRHVDRCAERFADDAEGWTPIEDPVGWALRSHALGSRPPGHTRHDEVATLRFYDMLEGALLADHLAARHLRAGGLRTMSSRNTPTIFAVVDDPTSQLEADAAQGQVRAWAALLHDSWVTMAGDGELALPGRHGVVDERWIDDFELLGLAFDAPVGVDATGGLRPYPVGAKRSDAGFAPLPEELGVQLRRLAERLSGRDLVVSSHGLATTDDGWRTEVLGATLDVIEAARNDGVSVRGYFHDTAIDGYEWRAGFETQRGLIARDRTIKESGDLFAERASALTAGP